MILQAIPKKRRTVFVRILVLVFLLLLVAIAFFVRSEAHAPLATCVPDCFDGVSYAPREPTKYLALTFDDGPSPNATPALLRVLEEQSVPATFFLVGERVFMYPEIVRDIARAGHTIGNHTFTSNERLVHESRDRILNELNRTNALIESLTGRSATLYRPPSLIDLDPFEVIPPYGKKPVWDWIYDEGYLPVGVDFDSSDWQVTTAEALIENVRLGLEQKSTQYYDIDMRVMLFHDLPHTAAALPEILRLVEDAGFTIIPLQDLLALSEDAAMPRAERGVGDVVLAAFMESSDGAMHVLMVLAGFVSLIAVLRIIGFSTLKLIHRRASNFSRKLLPRFSGTISVLIPAYNEEANIAATILSVLQNTRQPDEILVIDDGSRDGTRNAVLDVVARYPGRVRLLSQPNSGKAAALNLGVRESRGDIIIAIDGDTVLDPGCIDALARPFGEPRMGATAGKILPARTTRLMEWYQYLEYIAGQNIDKELISALGSVHIVPGAVGAWRREALLRAGGYTDDTLVEDQDLTLALLGMNYGVGYVADARAYTEVPTSLRSFFTQRFRWTYGTFQCLYKYRQYFFADTALRLGWISLPYALTFNVLLPVIAMGLNVAMLIGALVGLAHPLLFMLIVFTLLDMLYALIALLDEPRAPKRAILHVPVARLVYLAVYTVLVAFVLLKFLDGSPTRWNKLLRVGSATQFFRERLYTNRLQGA